MCHRKAGSDRRPDGLLVIVRVDDLTPLNALNAGNTQTQAEIDCRHSTFSSVTLSLPRLAQ